MLVVFVLFYHRIMYCRLLVMKDCYIRKAMDDMTQETEPFEYGNMVDTDLLKDRMLKAVRDDEDLYSVLIGVDSLFIDTILVPLLYDGMVAAMANATNATNASANNQRQKRAQSHAS